MSKLWSSSRTRWRFCGECGTKLERQSKAVTAAEKDIQKQILIHSLIIQHTHLVTTQSTQIAMPHTSNHNLWTKVRHLIQWINKMHLPKIVQIQTSITVSINKHKTILINSNSKTNSISNKINNSKINNFNNNRMVIKTT